MSTATLPAPIVPDVGDDDLDRAYCCDPNRSLCGLDISGDDESELDMDRLCPLCKLAFDTPCRGKLFCRTRWTSARWFR